MDSSETLIGQARGGQVWAIDELCDRDPRRAVAVVLELAQDSDEALRLSVADALGKVGQHDPENAAKVLLGYLTDPSDMVRNGAAEALGALGTREAVTPLMALLLEDPDWIVRCSAAEALGDIGEDRAVSALLSALRNDEEESVRGYAADSLGLLGDPSLLPELAALLATESWPKARASIHGARYRLGSAEDLDPILVLLESASEHLTIVIFNILADLAGRGRAIPAEDAVRIRDAVVAAGQRYPLNSGHAQKIVDLLSRSNRLP